MWPVRPLLSGFLGLRRSVKASFVAMSQAAHLGILLALSRNYGRVVPFQDMWIVLNGYVVGGKPPGPEATHALVPRNSTQCIPGLIPIVKTAYGGAHELSS